jgi:hypothetical protein
MRKMFFLFACLIALISANLYPVKAVANGSDDNFFPVAQVVLTPVFLSEDAGFSALLEGGPRSYRFNGTLGYIACEQHRFKVGGEYLAQRFKFHHHRDDHDHDDHRDNHHWVHQWAVGGKYQYLFTDDCCNWLKYFQFDGYYSKAKNKDLRYSEYTEEEDTVYIHRRISGASSWGLEAGTAIDTCWNNGSLYVGINYDDVRFNKHRFFDHHHDEEEYDHDHYRKKNISGVGATVALDQPLWCDVDFGIKYQYKRAYDYLEALLDWTNRLECGDLTLGIFVNQVWGKEHIQSSTTLGFSAGFTFGLDNWSLFGDCCAPRDMDCCVADCSDLASWIADPAVYMPQVLTRFEEHRDVVSNAPAPGNDGNNNNVGNANNVGNNNNVGNTNNDGGSLAASEEGFPVGTQGPAIEINEASTETGNASTGTSDSSTGTAVASTGTSDSSTGTAVASTGTSDSSTGTAVASTGTSDSSIAAGNASTGTSDSSTGTEVASTGTSDSSTDSDDASEDISTGTDGVITT